MRLNFLFLIFISQSVTGQEVAQKDTSKLVVITESTLQFPLNADEDFVSGKVTAIYDLDSNCRITNIRIEKSLGKAFDEEVIKSLKNSKIKITGNRKKCSELLNLRQSYTFSRAE